MTLYSITRAIINLYTKFKLSTIFVKLIAIPGLCSICDSAIFSARPTDR